MLVDYLLQNTFISTLQLFRENSALRRIVLLKNGKSLVKLSYQTKSTRIFIVLAFDTRDFDEIGIESFRC